MDIFFVNFPNGKAVKTLKQANFETTGAIKTSKLTREPTQVNPEAREGKPRAQDRPQNANKQHFNFRP
jgi:hypothetical protein